MPLTIDDSISIPDGELELTFVRSSGPGGQNVNKVASAVQLRFDLKASMALPEPVKSRVRARAGRRLTDEGVILIIARNHRSQEQNRREAMERLADLIRAALVAPKARRATKPTAGSRERRLDTKVRRQRTKVLRRRVDWEG